MEMFTSDLLDSFSRTVNKDLVLKTVISSDLHCQLEAVSVEPVTNMCVIASCELVRPDEHFFTLMHFSKLKGKNSRETHRFLPQHTRDLLSYLNSSLVIKQRLHHPCLSQQFTLLFWGWTFQQINFEMSGEVKVYLRFFEYSD